VLTLAVIAITLRDGRSVCSESEGAELTTRRGGGRSAPRHDAAGRRVLSSRQLVQKAVYRTNAAVGSQHGDVEADDDRIGSVRP